MFQAKSRGYARLAAGLLLVPGLMMFDVVVLPRLNQTYAQDARPMDPGSDNGSAQAQQMMKQAREAFDRGNFDLAADLANRVKAMNVTLPFWATGLSPDQLLADIAAKTGRKPKITVSTTALPTKPTQEDPRLLMKKSRDALDVGHLDDAMKFARQAELNGKNTSWGLFEESPSSLVKDVQKAQVKHNRAEADRMLSQARNLYERKAHNDTERAAFLDKAKVLAKQSETLHGEYSMWDLGDRPASLIKDIDAARSKIKVPVAKQPTQRPTNPNQSGFATANPANGQGTTNSSPYTAIEPKRITPPKDTVVSRPINVPLDPTPGLDDTPKKPVVTKNDPILPPFEDRLLALNQPKTPVPPANDFIMPKNPGPKAQEPVPQVDPRKAEAIRLMQQARAKQQAEKFLEAKDLLFAAQRQEVIFSINEESPGMALQVLKAEALKKIQSLCREAHDGIMIKEAKSLAEAEQKLIEAQAIAQGMAFDTSAIHEHLQMLVTAKGKSSATGSAAVSNPVVSNPMQEPPMLMPGAPGANVPTPIVQVGVKEIAPPQVDPGKVLLNQGQAELRAGQLESARRIVTQLLNGPYACKGEAEDLLRTIDAEEFVQRQRAARKAYTNAIFAYQQQNFEHALAIFRQIDPSLLDPNQRTSMTELMGYATKIIASKQAPASTIVRTGAGDPGMPTTLPPIRKPSMNSDMQTDPMATRTGADSMLKQTEAMQQIAFQKLRSEGLKVESDATARFGKGETDEAIQDLKNFIAKVKQAELDPSKVALLTRPIETRLARLGELKHRTDFITKESRDLRAFKSSMTQEALTQQHKQEEVAALLKKYNVLFKEHKFLEAGKVAMQASALDPDNPVSTSMAELAKMAYRKELVDKGHKDNEGFNFREIQDTLELGTYASHKNPVVYDKDHWAQIANRPDYSNGFNSMRSRSQKEKDIEMMMEKSIPNIDFKGTPLEEVIRFLQLSTQVNIVLDIAALNQKNLPTNTPVTMTLHDIKMKSAVKTIVEQVGLDYVIENDALKITTHEKTRGKLMQKTIPVADLVIPVRNNPLPAIYDPQRIAESEAENSRSRLGGGSTPFSPTMGLRNGVNASTSSNSFNSAPAQGSTSPGRMINTSANEKESDVGTIEQSLIRLIMNTIKPDTWASVGGSGTIEYYPLGMALVINQTPDVVGEIEVLLEQLRRLQDLEIAVEIRVISLSDIFYERIGVDFSMNIQTHNSTNTVNAIATGNFTPSSVIDSTYQGIKGAVIGLQAPGVPTPNLAVPISPSSYNLAVPPFGGYNNNPGSNGGLSLGLSFLNDVQVSMFLEAAQGDQRTNIMQAPKLTLFNGGTSTIAVFDRQYFLTNVTAISVNGQLVFQPTNTAVTLGTTMTIQAVATGDRRFVRLGIAQTMTNLSSASVQLFPITTFITPTFEGGFQGQPIPFTQYVQQPTFSTIFVQTTVVVPDGGTVMIGGLKTLQEGRNEYGPPVLSKIPYINRLFKNVGYGREARSLLMMVTPRIIINREEEFKQTGLGQGNDGPGAEQ